ncbi:MAG: S9 family peptidase [Deltaproteobacteria bacterium]|nr:S9 family peptidase [Deltaproteobacteria bacterium]
MRKGLILTALFCLAIPSTLAAQPKPFDAESLVHTRFVADMVPSPSGDFAVIRLTDWDGGDRFLSDYHLVKVSGAVTRLTGSGKSSGPFAISPDETQLVFFGEREGKKGLFLMGLAGGEPRLLREMPVEAENIRWVKGGIFFSAMVAYGCGADFDCTKKRLDEARKTTSALVFEYLLHRPWNSWRNGTFSNLFVMDPEGKQVDPVAAGAFDVPAVPLGGRESYSVSEDGKTVVFAVKFGIDQARSTNFDLYETTRGPDGKWSPLKRLTSNPGTDNDPILSPDGTRVAYLSQDTPGFESDLWRLRVVERANQQVATPNEKLDRWVTAFDWAPDGKRIFYVTEDTGYRPLYVLDLGKGTIEEEAPRTVVKKMASSRRFLWHTRESMTAPPELWVMDVKTGATKRVAGFNADVTGRSFGRVEEIWYDGSKGKGGSPRQIQAFIIMPSDPPKGKKVPLVMMLHGGPQGAWLDSFHPRWNPMVFASMGFAVALPNFTGSTGYGQEFVNAVSKDWGGAPYEDVMALLDKLDKDTRIDAKNACAIGGSYGGYLVNWIAGHTDRFKCLVSHAGVFNLASKYGTTDELWFPEWEFGGAPWTNPQSYEKWSPHNYVKNFKTPIMVVHGQNDFRVPIEQGLGMFQYAKVMGIEARLVYFPDEDHFVSKPKNRKFWYETVGAWMKKHTGMK